VNEAIMGMLIAPILLFLFLVAPIWLILHYRSKRQVGQGLTEEEYRQLNQLGQQAEKMSERIRTLEAILDEESPDWRRKV